VSPHPPPIPHSYFDLSPDKVEAVDEKDLAEISAKYGDQPFLRAFKSLTTASQSR
jgi:hypothetical protein